MEILKTDLENNDFSININKDFLANDDIIKEENELELLLNTLNSNSSLLLNDKEKENDNDKNIDKEANMDYQKFKEKFVTALKELEKDKKMRICMNF